MGNRTNLRNIPGNEPGFYGAGSVDIKHLKIDFLDYSSIPTPFQVLDTQRMMWGRSFYQNYSPYHQFKRTLIDDQKNYINEVFERRESRSITNQFSDMSIGITDNFYKRNYGGIKNDTDTNWIPRLSKGYCFYEDEKQTYTARISSLETWCNGYFGTNERSNENSKVFKKYVERTENYPLVTSEFSFWDETNNSWKWSPNFTKFLSDGNVILLGDAPGDFSSSTDPNEVFNDTTLTPGFYKLDSESGEIDRTFFIKNSNGARGVFSSSNIYNMFVANDSIFIFGDFTIDFDDDTFSMNKVYKFSSDGTLDGNFFPDITSSYYDSLFDITYVNGYFYLSFFNFTGDYGTLLADENGNARQIIRVDVDGTNPVSMLSSGVDIINGNYFSDRGSYITSNPVIGLTMGYLYGKPAIFDDGSIIAFCHTSWGDHLIRINSDGEFDLSYTFNENDHPVILNKKIYTAKIVEYNQNNANMDLVPLSDGSILTYKSYQPSNRELEVVYVVDDKSRFEELYVSSDMVKTGGLVKITPNGNVDFDFNDLGLFSNFGKRDPQLYSVGFSSVRISDVNVIDDSIYVSIVDSDMENSTYRGSNETLIGMTNLVRLNLDGSLDVDFAKLQYFGGAIIPFEKYGKLYIYSRPSNYPIGDLGETSLIRLQEVFDSKWSDMNLWYKIPTIGKRALNLDSSSYIQSQSGEWSIDNPQNITTITKGNLFKIDESTQVPVSYFSLVHGENYYSRYYGNNSVFTDIANVFYYMSYGGGSYHSDNFTGYERVNYDNEMNVFWSSDNAYNYIFKKYYGGFLLTPEEERFVESAFSAISEYYSSEKWNKDMFNQEWWDYDPITETPGYNPLFPYIDYISLNATMDMSMADIFGASDFNILSSSKMPVANIDKLVDGNPGDIFWSHDANTYYMWNPGSSKWEPFLGNMIGDMIIPDIKDKLNSKLNYFKEISNIDTPFTWSNYHILRANLVDFMDRVWNPGYPGYPFFGNP